MEWDIISNYVFLEKQIYARGPIVCDMAVPDDFYMHYKVIKYLNILINILFRPLYVYNKYIKYILKS